MNIYSCVTSQSSIFQLCRDAFQHCSKAHYSGSSKSQNRDPSIPKSYTLPAEPLSVCIYHKNYVFKHFYQLLIPSHDYPLHRNNRKRYKKGTSRQYKILRKCFVDCILIISGLVTGFVSTDKRHKETKQGTTIANILNSTRHAYFVHCVCCTTWALNNNRNDMKATHDAWNMCINKSIVDSWFFGVNDNKGG